MFEDLNVDFTGTFASDIEANELLEKVSKVWCIVSICMKTNRVFVFHDYPEYDNTTVTDPETNEEFVIPKRTGTLTDGARFWWMIGNKGGKLSVHNALGYDKFVIDKFWPKCKIPDETWHDTLIQSKLQWFDRETPKGSRGNHGLQAYGCRFGVMKPEVKDWSFFDGWKLHRCIEDCKIQALTHKYLEKEALLLKERLGIEFNEGIARDHEYRKNATKQELNGAFVDKSHMQSCVAELTQIVNDLKNEIEPQLPKQVKPSPTKVSKSELCELLGLPPVKDTYVIEDGVTKVDKPYVKPTTKFTKTEKFKKYSAYHPELKETTFEYETQKELKEYIKDLFPNTKMKEWEIKKEEGETVLLNANTCSYFGLEPESKVISGPFTKVEFKDSSLSQGNIVKSFLISLGWKEASEWTLKKDSDGQIMRAKEQMVVTWPEKPLYGNPDNVMTRVVKKGQPIPLAPQLTDDCFETLPEGLGQKISDYNTYGHRLRFLANPEDDSKGLLNSIREDGRITCGLNVSATATYRSSHRNWVNAPSVSALYGEKIRKSIIAPEGKVLVGADQKSAQLSIAAYYANNFEYYKAVADGKEVKTNDEGVELINTISGKPWYIGESGHCVNARMFTLVSEEEWKRAVETQDQDLIHSISLRRKKSKGGSFAVIFGASGKKVATTLGIPESLGEVKKQAFLSNIGLDEVIDLLKVMYHKNARCGGGYIEIPFGYHAWCKQEHKLFNYLDQGTEAACQKWAVNYFEDKATKLHLPYKKIVDYHKQNCGTMQ